MRDTHTIVHIPYISVTCTWLCLWHFCVCFSSSFCSSFWSAAPDPQPATTVHRTVHPLKYDYVSSSSACTVFNLFMSALWLRIRVHNRNRFVGWCFRGTPNVPSIKRGDTADQSTKKVVRNVNISQHSECTHNVHCFHMGSPSLYIYILYILYIILVVSVFAAKPKGVVQISYCDCDPRRCHIIKCSGFSIFTELANCKLTNNIYVHTITK